MTNRVITDFDELLLEVLNDTDSLFQMWESTDRSLRCTKALALLMRVVDVTNKFEVLNHHLKECFPPVALTNYEDWCKSIHSTKLAVQKIVRVYEQVEQDGKTDLNEYLKEVLQLEADKHDVLVALEQQLTDGEKLLLETLTMSFDYLLEIMNMLHATLTGDRTEALTLLYVQAEARYKTNIWDTLERKRYLKHLQNTKYPWGYEPTVEQLRTLYADTFNVFSQSKLGKVYDEFHDTEPMALAIGISQTNCSTDELNEYFKQIHRLRELRILADKKEKGMSIFAEDEKLPDNLEKEKNYPASTHDCIFNKAIDVDKVKAVINNIIDKKGKEGSFRLSVKWWFVVHRVLEEIDWLDDQQDTKFVLWVGDVYEWKWKERGFQSVLPGFKHTHSMKWNADTVKNRNTGLLYKEFADYVRGQFVDIGQDGSINDKVAFMNLGSDGKPMYIGHGLKRK